ncbi:MAG: hypothetical protein Q9M19_08900 [Mariprofundaceae bacterium]|nr:hypothetical protein [Mariprofundaceae bacterium]
MSQKPANDHHYPRLAYVLITIMLMMPVVLWPAPIFIYDNPMLADILTPTWLLCSTFLLLSAVIIDSMLYGMDSLKKSIDATLWISLFAMFAISAVQNQGGSWLLAMLFLLHALRSGLRLCWQKNTAHMWWLWLSWSRDTAAALTLLAWSSLWQS